MSQDPSGPHPDGLRRWTVAGGVVRSGVDVLLVENVRRNGRRDWSTPGGVVDPGEDVIGALTREVIEETGLAVAVWNGPLYRVEVTAPELGFHLFVEAHLAEAAVGDLHIDDPDGIVVAARFCSPTEAVDRLDSAPRFVREPLLAHLDDGVADGRTFRYYIDGSGDDRRVVRLDDGG